MTMARFRTVRWSLAALGALATLVSAKEGLRRSKPGPLSAASAPEADACGGVKVYIYRDLPRPWPEFEGRELLDVPPEQGRSEAVDVGLGVPCRYGAPNACAHLADWGRGESLQTRDLPVELQNAGITFKRTLQNALPWMFTGHIMAHCAVETPEEADLFYVPYPIVSLKRAVRRGYLTVPGVDEHYEAVKAYLAAQPAWQRCDGCDHIISMEAPIIDYGFNTVHRRGGYFHEDPFWFPVTRLSHHSAAYETTGPNNTAVALPVLSMPWPLILQPETDAQIEQWLDYVFAPDLVRHRDALLVANFRPHRKRLLQLCHEEDSPCLNGAAKSTTVYFAMYREHTFSIQPGGEVPTRRAFFDSLIVGCIPIVFAEEAAVAGRTDGIAAAPASHYRQAYRRYFDDLGWGDGWLERVALVANDEEHAMQLVRETSDARIIEMQAAIRGILPRLLFWDHTAPRDAIEAPSAQRHLGVVPTALRALADDVRAAGVRW